MLGKLDKQIESIKSYEDYQINQVLLNNTDDLVSII